MTCGACVIALVFPAYLGVAQSRAFSSDWPNSSDFLAVFGPIADHANGPLLVEDPAVAEYYLPVGAQWQRWSSTRNITLPDGTYTGGPASGASVTGAGNAPVYASYIAHGYFSVVALNFIDTTTLDHQITADLHRNPHYHVVQVVPYGMRSLRSARATTSSGSIRPAPSSPDTRLAGEQLTVRAGVKPGPFGPIEVGPAAAGP